MTSPETASDQTTSGPAAAVDVLVVGGGITGIYQLYRAREAGFSAQLLEAGRGVGGTWYWNRYPGARFDSESYTYAYLFSRELFEDWEWREHFAEQPEIERYLNHVVDRFDLRRHMRFDARVTSAEYDEATALWTVTDETGTVTRAHHFVAATGVLSIPYFPDIPGRGGIRGRVVPHWIVAGRARRLHRQAGCRRRHRVQRRADHPGHRRDGGLPHGAAALAQLVHAAQQRADHARRAGPAPEGLRGDPRHPEHIAERIPPRPARPCRLRRLGGGARRVLRGNVEEPRLLEAHQQLHRRDVRRRCERSVV